MRELTTIFDAIPHDQLAVQWDTNFEFAMLDGVMPTWFDDPRASIVERLVRLGRSIPARRAARLPLLPRPRAAPPRAAVRRPAARRDRQRPLAEPGPPARLDPPAGRRAIGSTCASSRRWRSCRCGPRRSLYLGLLHPGDGLVGAKARIVAAQRFVHDFGVATDCGWGRHRPQDVETLLELHRAVTDAHPTPSLRTTQPFEWPAGWERVPDDDWTPRSRRRLRRGLRQRRPPRLVPQPRPDRRGARAPARRRRHPDRLLGRHRHPARPPEAAHVRRADRRGDRRQLAQVPPCRAREVPRRPEGRLPPAAVPQGREAAAAARGGARARAGRAGRRRDRVDERHPPVSRPGRHRGVVGARACAPVGTCSSTRETSATRGPARSEWILDETVWVVGDLAEGLVRTDPRLRGLHRRPRRRASG